MNHVPWQDICQQLPSLVQPIFDQARGISQTVIRKDDGSLLTQTDLALQQVIGQRLAQLCPDVPVLGEEMTEAEQQAVLATGTCWLLDPLDGTSNFSHAIPVYSVSLALLWEGRVVAGLVYDPNRQELFHAQLGQGAYLNALRLQQQDASQPERLQQAMALIDSKRLDAKLATAIFIQHPYHSQRSFGSVALEWCWLAAGRIHTYLHGKQKLWDYSAGALIAQEAGCLAVTFQGESILSAPIDLVARSAIGACPSLKTAWFAWICENQ
jgi:myo-inositol-1(or 4)-monophosphatase